MISSQYILNILDLILDGDNGGKEARPQLAFLTDINYDYTDGAGLFVSFSHEKGINAYRLVEDKLILGGVTITSPELEIGADATVFFSDGLVDFLEIWSFDGNYPDCDLTSYLVKQEWDGSPGRTINVGV